MLQAASDCHAIASQSDVCSGLFRVTHRTKGKATLEPHANWKLFAVWA